MFTSNAFAVLGLRALYFLLAGSMDRFPYLKQGLAVLLVFIGAKMLISPFIHLPVTVSLAVIIVAVAGAVAASLWRDRARPARRTSRTGRCIVERADQPAGRLPLSYAIAVVIPALDAILPVLPSETAIIALGVATAGSPDPRIALLVACAAAGAFLGDNLCYVLGRRFGPRAERRFFSTAKGARRRAWAEHALQRFGMQVIIVCRFIPGGRTAVTLSCGLIGYPRRRFITATAIAGIIWALYAFFIGRLGGKAFEDKPWAGFLVAFGITIVISGLIEAVRRIRPLATAPPDRTGP